MQVDEELLKSKVITFILDWKGLTGEMLKGIFPLKATAKISDDEVCVCDDENKLYMLTYAYDFDTFVLNSITNIELFKE